MADSFFRAAVSPQRVKALRAAAMADASKMAGLTDAVRSYIADAWDSAAKEKIQLQCQAATVAAADRDKYKVRPLAPRRRVRAARWTRNAAALARPTAFPAASRS